TLVRCRQPHVFIRFRGPQDHGYSLTVAVGVTPLPKNPLADASGSESRLPGNRAAARECAGRKVLHAILRATGAWGFSSRPRRSCVLSQKAGSGALFSANLSFPVNLAGLALSPLHPLPNRRMLLSVTDRSRLSKPTDLVQGTLDLLILKTIALEPMHGWAIAQRI